MRVLAVRERKLIAAGILVAIFAVVWLGLLSPLVGGFFDRSTERSTLLAQYARNERILASIPVWKHQIVAQQRTLGRFALAGPTEALASQQLTQRLSRTVGDVGGVLRTSGPVGGAPPGEVKVRAAAELTMQQLYQVLNRLESEEPYVVVEYLSVTANRAFETGHLGPMDIRLQVAGFYRGVQPQ